MAQYCQIHEFFKEGRNLELKKNLSVFKYQQQIPVFRNPVQVEQNMSISLILTYPPAEDIALSQCQANVPSLLLEEMEMLEDSSHIPFNLLWLVLSH